MGTRIGNGFRFASRDFGEVDGLIRAFRSTLAKLHLKALARVHAEAALRRLDGPATASLRAAPVGEESGSPAAREWRAVVEAARAYVDRFGLPSAETALDRAARALAMRGPFDPGDAAPAVPSPEAAAFLAQAASMDPGLLPALAADRENPLSAAHAEIRDRQRQVERTRYRDPEVDFEFSIDVFADDGRFYGMVRTDRPEWRKLWLAQPGVEDFAYWDGTDPPEGMDEAEWAARQRKWDEIMPSGIPARSCWTATLIDTWTFIGRDEIPEVLAEIPPFGKRVGRVARGIVLDARMRELGAMEAMRGDISEIMRIHREADDWMDAPEGREALAAMENRVAALLQRDLTEADLLGWDPNAKAEEKRQPETSPPMPKP